MFCQHLREDDFLRTNSSTVPFTPITHQVSNKNRTSIEERIPVLCCNNIELPFECHDCRLTFTFCSSIHPADTEQIEHLFRVLNHFWAVMDNALRHLLRRLVVAVFECLLVCCLSFKTTFSSCCELIRLQFRSRSIENENRLNAERKHGCCSRENAHQVSNDPPFGIPERPTITCRRSISNRRQELKRS